MNNPLIEKLQKHQNRAARVITKSTYKVSFSPLLDSFSWEHLTMHGSSWRGRGCYVPPFLVDFFFLVRGRLEKRVYFLRDSA